jgi:large subunit ribosomal protein L25
VADFTLEVQPRSITGKKVSQLRNQGFVPATVYGPKSQPMNIQVPYRALELTLMKAGGTNLIDLQVDGRAVTVLARHVQRNVLKRTIIHVDFYQVDLATKIRTAVPVHFINESPAVAAKRGVLITGPTSINIETLPRNLLHVIEVDLSPLKEVGDTITVGDLKLGEDVTIMDDAEEMLAKVVQTSAARAEEDLEAAEAAASSSEPEVIHRGKQEEEDF